MWSSRSRARTARIGNDGLRLTTVRTDRGAATGLDVRQAEELLYTATAQIAALSGRSGKPKTR